MSSPTQASHAFHGVNFYISATVSPENVKKFHAVTAKLECRFLEVMQDTDTYGRFKWVEKWSKD